ncbi:MAG TPA: hypothetical protein VMB74_07720 [Streptosporangiaceae bacterium]|nr:hypothetical protein [Streptosporangiaceae bacterium]
MFSPALKDQAPGPRRQFAAVSAVAVVAITAGLALAGCGGSGNSGSSGSTGSSTTPASSSTHSAASSSTSSGSSGSTTETSSLTLPFPVGVGDTWTYKTTYGRTVNRMTAVTPVSGGQEVTMASAITSLGSTSNTSAYYVVHADGSISLPFSQFSTSSSGSTVKLISGSLFWPPAAQLAAGQTSHSTLKIEFSQGGVSKRVTAHIAVTGEGTQSVTVPAGTYTATVVNMTMSETIEGFSVGDTVRTWLAAGVGPVKTEVILDEAGAQHVAAEDQLVSFKAG